MSNTKLIEEFAKLSETVDEVLNDWHGEGNLQFPNLMTMMATKLNWDEKKTRECDPIVRYCVRNHPDWYVTRGAHGGIMRVSDKKSKETSKTTKATLKAQMKAEIEAKVALSVSNDQTTNGDAIFSEIDAEPSILDDSEIL
jgi:hypothetical protein